MPTVADLTEKAHSATYDVPPASLSKTRPSQNKLPPDWKRTDGRQTDNLL